MDDFENFAYSKVTVAPSPPMSGTTLTVESGDGVVFPTPPFQATVWPLGEIPVVDNAEIVRVTAVAGDVLTVTRSQESTAARGVLVGDQIVAALTKKTLTDLIAAGGGGGGGGTTILTGTATPTAGDGAEGDYYLDADDNILYGPKATAPVDEYVTQSPLSTDGGMYNATYGMKYRFAVGGYVTGVRVFIAPTAYGATEAYLFRKSDGVMLASKDFTATTGQWNSVTFDTPVPVSSGVTYIAAFYTVDRLQYTNGAYAGQVSGNVTALAQGVDGPACTYTLGRDSFPTTDVGATFGISPIFNTAGDIWPVALSSGASRTTATVTTASLAANAAESGTVTLANGYRLLRIATSRPARVRLYTTTAKRDADASRAVGTDPTGDHGLVLDYVTTGSMLAADLSPTVDGFDGKATPDGVIGYHVTNLGTTGTVIVTFTWIATEV